MNKSTSLHQSKSFFISSYLKRCFFTLLAVSFALAGVAQDTFTGTGNWNSAGNWSAGIPTATTDVIISGNVTVNSAAAVCQNITINGSLALSNDGLTVGGSWTNNGTFSVNCNCAPNVVTFTGNNSTLGGTGTTNFYILTINTTNPTDVVSLANSNISVADNGQLNLTNGIFKVGAANTFYMGANGATTINATNGNFASTGVNGSDGGTIIVDKNGGGGPTFTTTATSGNKLKFYNLEFGTTPGNGNVHWSVTNSNSVFVNGTLTVQDNNWGFSNTGNPPVYGPASTLSVNNNGQQFSPASGGGSGQLWQQFAPGVATIGVTPGYPNNVIIANTGNSASNYNGNQYGVKLSGSWSINGTFQVGTSTVPGLVDLDNGGTGTNNFSCGGIIIEPNSKIAGPGAGGTFDVNGSWTRDASGNFTPNSGTVTFGGAGTDVISVSSGTENSFNSVTVNANVKLSSPVTMGSSGILTLTSGIVQTDPTNVLTVTNTATTAITGGSATSFVSGPLAWTMAATSSASYIFPVGGGATFLPLTLSPNTNGATTATVRAFNTGSGGTPDGITVSSLSTTEYWSVSTTVPFTTGADVSVTRPTGVGLFNALAKSTSAGGIYSAIGGTVSGNSITNASMGTTSPWFLSLVVAPLSVEEVSSVNATCSGTTGSITVQGSGGKQPYSYQIDGGAYSAPTAGSFTFTGLLPGPHSAFVKDNTGATAGPVTVTLLGSLQINSNKDTTICSGTSAKLVATNLTATPATPTPTFSWSTSPTGTPVIGTTSTITVSPVAATTTYYVTSQLFNNVLNNPGFESGNTGFTTDYAFSTTSPYGAAPGGHGGLYYVCSQANQMCTGFTPTTPHGGGLMLACDGPINGSAGGPPGGSRIWYQNNIPVSVGTTYTFSFYYAYADASNPNQVQTYINGVAATGSANPVTMGAPWSQAVYTWTANSATASIALYNVGGNDNQDIGNDFLLDDLAFFTPCQVTDSIKVNVGNAALAGTVTPALQNICKDGTPSADLQLTGNSNPVVRWEYSTDKTFATGVTQVTTTSQKFTAAAIGALGLTTSTYFRAVVSGCSAGATINTDSVLIAVVPPPTITGTTTVCAGSTTQLTGSGTPSGSNPWTSLTLSSATVNNTGLVTGVAQGTSQIIYTNNTGCTDTTTVTVNAEPTVTGTLILCEGSTTQLTGSATAAASNPWTSLNTAIATVTNGGLISGVAGGTAKIVYANNSGCTDTVTVTVNATPTVTGTLNSCAGSTTQLTGSGTAAASNPWTSLNTAVATVNGSGLVSGVSAGTSQIVYANNSGCTDTVVVTINSLPLITGALAVSKGNTTQLTGSGTTGSPPWQSLTPSIATIDNTGKVTGVADGTTKIVYTNSSGCTDTVTFTVSSSPIISGDTVLCIGTTSQLAGSGTPAASNPWVSATPSVATISNAGLVTAISAGTSVVTYTDNSGKDTATTIIVNALPTVTGTLKVCLASTTQLAGSGIPAVSNAWISVNSLIAQVNNTGLVTGISAGTGKIVYTNNSGCTDTVTVTVDAVPFITGTSSVCVGKTTQFASDSLPANANAWVSLNTSIATVDNTGLTTGVSSGAGAIIYTDLNGCKDSFTVTVNALPSAPTGTGGSRCGTGTVTLGAAASGNPADILTWYSDPGLTTQVATGTSFTTPNISTTTQYYVTETNASGCTSATATTVTATINSGPTPPTGTGSSRCGAGTLTLTATLNGNPSDVINWYSDAGLTIQVATGTNFTTPSINAITNYYITEVNTSGCASIPVTVIATVNQPPAPPAPKGGAQCGTGTVTLTVTPSGAGTDAITWYSDAGLTTQVATGTSFTTPSLTTTTSYYVTESNAAACTSTPATVTATINTAPTAPVGADASRCGAGNVSLGATPSANPADTIKWYSDAGLTTQVATGTSFATPSISTTTPYYVTETSAAGCASTSSTTVTATIDQTPPAPTTSDVTYCQSATALALTANGNNLTWYTNGRGSSIAPVPSTTAPGSTTYYVTSSNGNCESPKTGLTVTVNPISAYAGGPVVVVNQGQSVTLNGSATGDNITITWTPDTYLSSASIENPVVTLLTDSITYTMSVTSATDGCSATDQVQVILLKDIIIPNAFSPNGDGINDKWIIKFIEQYPASDVSIFNRYGQLISETTGYGTSNAWDGTYKGKPVPVGTYYYIIKLAPGKAPLSGYIAVVR